MNDDRLVNLPAEAALLGAMLLDNKLVEEWSDRVRPVDFADALHGRIYSAMLKFAAKGLEANAITLLPIFQHDEDAQYGAYLESLVDSDVVSVGAGSFAAQIIDLSGRRTTRTALHEAMEGLSTDFDRPVAEITGGIDEVVWASASRTEVAESNDAGDMVDAVIARDNRIAEGGSAGMSNRLISDLDKGLGPLEAGTYNIVAGRPGMGKTVIAGSAALGYALNGHPGLMLGAEMTKEQHALRVVADLSLAMGHPIPHADLRRGGLTPEHHAILQEVRRHAKILPLRFIETGPCDVKRIWSLTARHKAMWAARGRKLEFVVIDYLGLLEASDEDGRPIENSLARMNKISKTLNRMKTDLDVAVIALAQLSRGVEARVSKRPVMSDLKETGNLEQDADSVLLLFRDEYYLEQSEPKRGEKDVKGVDLHEAWEVEMNIARGKIDLIVGKNRHARVMTRTAKFIGKQMAVRGGDIHEEDQDNLLI